MQPQVDAGFSASRRGELERRHTSPERPRATRRHILRHTLLSGAAASLAPARSLHCAVSPAQREGGSPTSISTSRDRELPRSCVCCHRILRARPSYGSVARVQSTPHPMCMSILRFGSPCAVRRPLLALTQHRRTRALHLRGETRENKYLTGGGGMGHRRSTEG